MELNQHHPRQEGNSLNDGEVHQLAEHRAGVGIHNGRKESGTGAQLQPANEGVDTNAGRNIDGHDVERPGQQGWQKGKEQGERVERSTVHAAEQWSARIGQAIKEGQVEGSELLAGEHSQWKVLNLVVLSDSRQTKDAR